MTKIEQTLDRLAREQKERENRANEPMKPVSPKVIAYAERIFFEKMLKDINPGMSDAKVEEKIDRSIQIASMLVAKFEYALGVV